MYNLTEVNKEYLKKVFDKQDDFLKGKTLKKIRLPMITDKPYEE